MELINDKPLTATKTSDLIPKNGRTAVLTSPGHFEFREFEFRPLTENEILVQLEGCGLCASNIPVWQGREWFNYPLNAGAPGHEGWGIVKETGANVNDIKPGQHVSLLSGDAFSTHVICDAGKAVVLPEALQGSAFPGEPLGCAMNIFNRSDIKAGQTVAILGIGFLGALLIQLAKKRGVNIIAISRRESSLELAREMGADICFGWDEKDKIHQYIQDQNKQGCERVIECVGKQKALDLATEIIGERGKLIVAGYHQEDLRHINMQIWNWKGIDVINAHERDEAIYKDGIRKAARAVKDGDIDLKILLTHEFSFNKINKAMETLAKYPEGLTKAYIKYI